MEKYLNRNTRLAFLNILFGKLVKVIQPEQKFISGPMHSIFITTVYNKEILEGRLRELAFLNRGVRIILNDLREKEEDGTTYTKSILQRRWYC